MSTTNAAHKAEIAARKYATKFYLETVAEGKPLEPTDANLAQTPKDSTLRPRPECFEDIRRVLAEDYGVTLSPATIVLQAAEAYADEIEGRNHDAATIAKGESIRAAAAQLRAPARIDVGLVRQQRDWLLSLRADTPIELARMVKAGTEHFDGLVNLLDAMLDSAEGYTRPLEEVGELDRRIHIVERATGDGDNLYAFEDEDRAREFAERYPGAIVHEEILMNDCAAAQFLIDTAEDEPE